MDVFDEVAGVDALVVIEEVLDVPQPLSDKKEAVS